MVENLKSEIEISWDTDYVEKNISRVEMYFNSLLTYRSKHNRNFLHHQMERTIAQIEKVCWEHMNKEQ